MGCNASQEPIIVPNENGNATMVDAAAEGDDDNGKPPQSLSHQGQQQQQQSNQSEPEVSATNNDPNVRPSPGNKTMMMTPQSGLGPPMAEQEDAELAEEGFVGNKNTPSSPPVDNEVGSEQAEDEESQMVPSRAQSSATKTISSSSAGSARSSAKSSVVAEEQQQGNHRGLNSGGEKKESVTANRLEICSDGASDLANNLPNSITETNANGTSTIELSEFGTEEGTRLAFECVLCSLSDPDYILPRHLIRMRRDNWFRGVI